MHPVCQSAYFSAAAWAGLARSPDSLALNKSVLFQVNLSIGWVPVGILRKTGEEVFFCFAFFFFNNNNSWINLLHINLNKGENLWKSSLKGAGSQEEENVCHSSLENVFGWLHRWFIICRKPSLDLAVVSCGTKRGLSPPRWPALPPSAQHKLEFPGNPQNDSAVQAEQMSWCKVSSKHKKSYRKTSQVSVG